LELAMAIVAVVLATINMVGGFVVTDRMLEMFKGKPRVNKEVEVGDSK
jgi:NAD(P) transhydrogenase subunit alpha